MSGMEKIARFIIRTAEATRTTRGIRKAGEKKKIEVLMIILPDLSDVPKVIAGGYLLIAIVLLISVLIVGIPLGHLWWGLLLFIGAIVSAIVGILYYLEHFK